MKVSFDGLRQTLAREFNEFFDSVESDLTQDQQAKLMDIRGTIGGLLACYDPAKQPEDFNMLAEMVKLRSFYPEEDE